MQASNATAFDILAADYDLSFSRSLTGNSQRMRSRKWLSEFLQDKKNLNILEINCGTGDDAFWLASMGHKVVATDMAEAMIAEAKKKLSLNQGHDVQFLQSDYSDLQAVLQNEKFDLIFSNFSGLNCVPAIKLRLLNTNFHEFLKPGAHLAAVIFGKYNWWETLYYLSRFKFGKATRRWSKSPSVLQLKDGYKQPVYYYSIGQFCNLFNQFSFIQKKPVGLFIPPSYLESYMKKNPRFFRFLERMENRVGGVSIFTQLADHSYILLQKRER